jgi:hypothetical protein
MPSSRHYKKRRNIERQSPKQIVFPCNQIITIATSLLLAVPFALANQAKES